MKTDSLFSEFPEISTKQWKQKIQFELQGEEYNKTLVTKTPEDIHIKPFYTSEDIPSEAQPQINPTWNICEKIYIAKAVGANSRALNSIKKGAQSILFYFPEETVNLSDLFKDFPLETVEIHIETAFLSVDFISKLIALFKDTTAKIHLHLDPIGHLASSGNWHNSLSKDMETLGQIQQKLLTHTQFKTYISVNTALYQNAGATIIQQLAYALAHANEYLNAFTPPTITFKMAIGSNYFFEIAKLKALRTLWNTIASEYQITSECHIFCMPTERNKTLYDYNVNMLRTTTEYMSAILGGANTICTLPYDAFYHKNNEFASRIARNQLLILKHESYFDKVKNPSDGSYYIESITDDLAEKALSIFKQIEAGGGFLVQLKEHIIQKKIKESANASQSEFDEKELVLVGSNKYQNKEEKIQETLELYPFVKTEVRKTLIEPIIPRRLAEKIEQERLKMETK
ncbi:methylmalonyl-CoA mutase subunit beta [Joostella sp. CR20]|uniref:methylmalonyl-CoA mutase subunit beta n=1 Tax=Joostella sp. CR20 TaxID=2804312 RepID=UPI00313E95C8